MVLVAIADHFAVRWSESTVATRIEQRFPGSHATVTISSSPYLVRLAIFGKVENVHAHVTDVPDGRLRLDTVDVTANDLKVNRGDLVHGKIRLNSLSSATITARVSVAEVLRAYGLGDLADLGSLATGVQGTVQSRGQPGAGLVRTAVVYLHVHRARPLRRVGRRSAPARWSSPAPPTSVPPALQAAGAGVIPS